MKKIISWSAGICLLAMAPVFGQVQTLQVRIGSGMDDVEEHEANPPGQIYTNSSDLELTRDGSRGNQTVGMRFTNVTIPQGAVINKAYVQFTVDEDDAEPGTVYLHVEDADNSAPFALTPFDVSNRTTVNDSVEWANIPVWSVVGEAGADQQTPDLKNLVQQVVNRGGWTTGNALTVIATGTGQRKAESYNGSSTQAPLLVVEYIVPVTKSYSILSTNDDAEEDLTNGSIDLGSSDLEITTENAPQVIGMRFDQIDIPAGSAILNAYIQFTVDEATTTGNVDAVIAIEDVDNAMQITNSPGDLSGRAYSYAGNVIWNVPAFSNVGDAGNDQRTPDLAALVQEIVNRPGWRRNNAMLFGMADPQVLGVNGYTGNTGKRTAESRNGASGAEPKLVVNFAPPAAYQNGSFPVAKGSSWKYLDNGTDLGGQSWTAVSFNDSAWKYGDAILGYGNSNESTTLDFGGDANNKHITTYLRHTFEVDNASQYDSLVFDVLRDDGVVVYVNGVEAFRQNMPPGSVSASTTSSGIVSGSDENSYFRNKTDNLLQDGINVIAVELHQRGPTSSDLSFDMEVGFELPPLGPTDFPLTSGTEWNFLDNGSCLDGTNWKDLSFNDENWMFGAAPLGYGDPVSTTVSFGNDANNKYITTYFRRDLNVNLADITADSVVIGVRRDDGVAVYLNGNMIIRDNLPSNFDCNTTAPTTISGNGEGEFQIYRIAKSEFNQGLNQIAVELHNRDVFSSDVVFDMFIENEPVLNPGVDCSEKHIGCFTSIVPTAQTPELIISKDHRFQMIFKQGTQYTNPLGNLTTVPGNHDFTAYLPINGSSELGHLSVNHENTPGGVSMIDLHFNNGTMLWEVDTTRPVDFYNNDLVTTTRNCSGGITPWGTVISSEETRNGGDGNSDGYQDVGWLVEIDPFTAKVLDYENDGTQDKLWAIGRASHENAVINDDSVTLYTGEDGGSSALFKFIADTPGDLSQGKLYALQLDGPLIGREPSVSTGTWIVIPNSTQSDRNNATGNAIALGATNFNGIEDVEISPIDNKVYYTSKGNGRVYRFTENGNGVSNFETFVGGTSYDIQTDQGTYNEPWGGGNDNLAFDDKGNLWVLQDGGRNYVWLVRPDHSQIEPKVELFASFPRGSEPCGLTFSPDFRFGFISVQHPSGSNQPQMDASGDMVAFDKSATLVFALADELGMQPQDSMVVSNSDWKKSTVTTQTNLSGSWSGLMGGLPADSTFSIDAEEGQPYGYPQIRPIDGTEVLKTGQSITFFRKEFRVNDTSGLKARLRLLVDDQAEVYINGQEVAMINSFGVSNFRMPAHDILFDSDNSIDNGHMNGDTYNSYTTNLDTIIKQGINEITVAVRNLGKPSDKGGFSLRLDLENDLQPKRSLTFGKADGFRVFPNPTSGNLNVEVNSAGKDVEALVVLTDMKGRILKTETATGTETVKIDMSNLATGVYLIRVEGGNELMIQKVMKR